MKQVTKNMGSVVTSLEKAVNSMELQKITAVMDKFEAQFEHLDVHTSVIATLFSVILCFSASRMRKQDLDWSSLPH